MLAIKGRDGVWHHWWCGGGPLPEVEGPVVTFQADGHELSWIYTALLFGEDRANREYLQSIGEQR